MCVWVVRNSGIGKKTLLRSDFLVWPVFNMLSAMVIYYYFCYYFCYYCCYIHGNRFSAGWATRSDCTKGDSGRANCFVHPWFFCLFLAIATLQETFTISGLLLFNNCYPYNVCVFQPKTEQGFTTKDGAQTCAWWQSNAPAMMISDSYSYSDDKVGSFFPPHFYYCWFFSFFFAVVESKYHQGCWFNCWIQSKAL